MKGAYENTTGRRLATLQFAARPQKKKIRAAHARRNN
jgi:hypothetical protein